MKFLASKARVPVTNRTIHCAVPHRAFDNPNTDLIEISDNGKVYFNCIYDKPNLEIIKKGLIRGRIERIVEDEINQGLRDR
jgi:hypothetical protein